MRISGRIAAAIEILSEMETRHLPAKRALQHWGCNNRYAGSTDRAAIGNLVYDCLRNRASLDYLMESDSPRAAVLAASVYLWGEEPTALAQSFEEDRFAPEPITEAELAALKTPRPDMPTEIAANMPEWLYQAMQQSFGEQTAAEAAAMAKRAPIDIRTNRLKATPEKLLKALARYTPAETAYSPDCLRLPPVTGPKKAPNIEAEAAHGKGWFEIQDEGSQIAARLTGAKPGLQILDYCAGGGGKTLAMSALMENKGQIHAYDADKHRLRPIFERLKRAGCRNVQVHEAGDELALTPLEGSMDAVLVDAPCTGTGTWRRHPDAKWRLTEATLETRLEEQRTVLNTAARFVKPGGRLVYVTCSLLPAENNDQVRSFLSANSSFTPLSYQPAWHEAFDREPPVSAAMSEAGAPPTLTLTPNKHGTDGFFIAILQKSSAG